MREIAKNAPLIMQVFEENLVLKEKIREFEVDDEDSRAYNVREKIEVNMLFLTEVASRIDDSIRRREGLEEKLERMAYLVGISPGELSKSQNSPREVEELKDRVQELNDEILRVKKQKEEVEYSNGLFRNQLAQKSEEVRKAEDEREVGCGDIRVSCRTTKRGLRR